MKVQSENLKFENLEVRKFESWKSKFGSKKKKSKVKSRKWKVESEKSKEKVESERSKRKDKTKSQNEKTKWKDKMNSQFSEWRNVLHLGCDSEERNGHSVNFMLWIAIFPRSLQQTITTPSGQWSDVATTGFPTYDLSKAHWRPRRRQAALATSAASGTCSLSSGDVSLIYWVEWRRLEGIQSSSSNSSEVTMTEIPSPIVTTALFSLYEGRWRTWHSEACRTWQTWQRQSRGASKKTSLDILSISRILNGRNA